MNGVYQQLEASRKPENYHLSAHVQKIMFSYRPDGYVTTSKYDFVTVHEAFESPTIVLLDNCTLYTITRTEAVFVQNEPSWRGDAFQEDFFILGQYHNADKLIIVPLVHFNKLVEDLEIDEARIIFLHNQARSGSTLLTAIFKNTDRCICISEPRCLTVLCKLIFSDNAWHGATARRLVRNTIRILCKPLKSFGENVLAYVIKPVTFDAVSMEIIQEAFPEAVQLFIYRDPIDVSVSIRRIGEVLETFKLFYYLPNIGNISELFVWGTGFHYREYKHWKCAINQELEFGYRVSCISMYHYLRALMHGVKIYGLRYADLVTYEDKVIRDVFTKCRLPGSLADKAKEAMKKDSQGNSPISREKLEEAIPNPPKPTPEFLQVARAMSEEFDVPVPDVWNDKTFRLPNSLQP
ncbi:hypothetical protein LSH36_300g04075 [Paralvinella palmiformis]|uniref:Sulfotransferase n=1 Tax=Paralvinella palmiformis TaxID=53620 RepID=A0AAD9JHZ0_9ANNE|nr:hypothetical protein LSH36_300g04075 [Paralvinella palmiformis]